MGASVRCDWCGVLMEFRYLADHEAGCPKNLDVEVASLRSKIVTMRKALLLVAKMELHDKSLQEGNEGDAQRAMRAVRAALRGVGNG